jgi:hypothetical protein
MLSLFLPLVLDAGGIDVELTAKQLGFQFVPKVRAVVGVPNRYLTLYSTFCTAAQIADPANALCYEAEALASQAMRMPEVDPHGHIRFPLRRDVEVRFRVDHIGPWMSFQPAGNAIAHPLLTLAGTHLVEVVTRSADRPLAWSRSQVWRVQAPPPAGQPARGGCRGAAGAWLVTLGALAARALRTRRRATRR